MRGPFLYVAHKYRARPATASHSALTLGAACFSLAINAVTETTLEKIAELIAPLAFMIPIVIAGAIATILEWQFPRRSEPVPLSRWINSIVMLAVAIPMLAIVMPMLGYALARWTELAGNGILSVSGLPIWAKVILTILILDFLNFFSHLVMHRVNVFWRLHRVHHSDSMISASTSFLNHPLEVLATNVAGFIVIPFIGLQSEGVLIFGFLQFSFGIWQHSNVQNIPGQHHLGAFVITPDLHRIHHSADAAHHGSNLGLIFTIWDRMFGTFVRERDLDMQVTFGLDPKEWGHPETPVSLLIDPLRK